MKRLADLASSRKVERLLWLGFLLALPVTSFPWLPGVLGGLATVRPLAIYPLAVLAALVLVRRAFQEPLPKAFLPLLLFVVVVAISGSLAAVQPVPMFRFVTPLDRVIRNLLTLLLGIAFYFAAALVPQSRDDLRRTIRWLLLAFCVPLVWSSLQAPYVLWMRADPATWQPYFDRLNVLHHLLSIRNLQETRVSGLAYEPSWYAEQLSILVIPWLLTAVITRRSFFARRLGRFLVEDGLLVWTVAVMLLTFSRTGLVILMVQAGLAILMGSGQRVERGRGLARLLGPGRFWSRVALFAVAAAVFGAAVFALGSQNRYFSRLWRYFSDEEAAGGYWAYIAFGQRFIYWEAAFEMYAEHPVLGVGVGNFALYFPEALPAIRLFQYPEILDYIVPVEGRAELVTPKNLFLRLLAETGLVGLALYLGFWAAVGAEWLSIWHAGREDEERAGWARAFLLGMAGSVLVAFSTDSFALPTIWVCLGLVTAAARGRPEMPADRGA